MLFPIPFCEWCVYFSKNYVNICEDNGRLLCKSHYLRKAINLLQMILQGILGEKSLQF